MKKIFQNLLNYKSTILAIVILLILQAYCDLTLPQFTSNIIDVGIQNKGVEHILPDQISEEAYQLAMMNMTEDEVEMWTDSYEAIEGGYQCTVTDKETLEKLDHELLIPIVTLIQMQMGGTRETTEEMLESTGETMMHSMGVAFAVKCNESMGVDMDAKQMDYIWGTAKSMLGLAFIILAVSILVSFLAARVGARIGCTLRGKIFRKTVGFSSTEMDQFSTASLITRSTNDVQQIQMVSTMILRMLLYAPILGIGGVYKVIETGAGMGYVIAIALLVILGFVAVLMSIAMPKFKIMQTLIDHLNLISREILTGLSVIRAFGRERREEERFQGANEKLMKTQLSTNRVMTFMMPGMMLIMNGLVVAIMWVSAHRIEMGELQVGEMTAFITYSMQIVMSFLMLTMMSVFLPRAGVAADRIEEVLDTEIMIRDSKEAVTGLAHKGVVEFKNVNFRYPNAKEDVLEDINFVAKPGEITAIIGSTGSGKSTLIQLITRFYDITGGSLTLDGEEVRNISIETLRSEIGLVPQKGILFSGTIASNLRFGNRNATDETIKEAAEIAQAVAFIEEKSDKFDSHIAQGGSNVSGGQKQRLAIARAIVKDPKVYIFDDSFSALDMKTDVLLRKALAEKVEESTVIIVAQRISTILQADQIIVLDDGKIVGKGTHTELMKECEVYGQIASSQLSPKELEDSMVEEVQANE